MAHSEKVRALAKSLIGTERRELLPDLRGFTVEEREELDDLVFFCEGCGVWCSRAEENDQGCGIYCDACFEEYWMPV